MSNFSRPVPFSNYHPNGKHSQTYALPPSWLFTFYNYMNLIKFYISLRSVSTQHVAASSMVHTSKVRWPPLCYYWVYGFVKTGHMVQKFKCYRQTDTQVTTSNMAMLKSILFTFISQKANHYASYITVLSVCVPQLPDCHDIWRHILKATKTLYVSVPYH